MDYLQLNNCYNFKLKFKGLKNKYFIKNIQNRLLHMATKPGRRPNIQKETWGLSRTESGGKYVDLSSMKPRGSGGGDIRKNCTIC